MPFSTGFVRAGKSGFADVSNMGTVKVIGGETAYPPIV